MCAASRSTCWGMGPPTPTSWRHCRGSCQESALRHASLVNSMVLPASAGCCRGFGGTLGEPYREMRSNVPFVTQHVVCLSDGVTWLPSPTACRLSVRWCCVAALSHSTLSVCPMVSRGCPPPQHVVCLSDGVAWLPSPTARCLSVRWCHVAALPPRMFPEMRKHILDLHSANGSAPLTLEDVMVRWQTYPIADWKMVKPYHLSSWAAQGNFLWSYRWGFLSDCQTGSQAGARAECQTDLLSIFCAPDRQTC
jgi:hypothetical protein